MAQAGIHGLIGNAVRKWTPASTWLMLGIVLGSILPDADNLTVAVATVMKLPTTGLHRTFTHSFLAIVVVMAVFYLVNLITKQPRWLNLGIGLGIGIFLHILVDMVFWFDEVAILWPLSYTLNLWSSFSPASWWMTLMQPAEFLFFALFFLNLYFLARKQASDTAYMGKLRIWIGLQLVLFTVFLVLAFTMSKGFMTIYGAVYLLSLGLAVGVVIRMQETIEYVPEGALAQATKITNSSKVK